MVKLATNDSMYLVDGLSEASIAEHGLNQYIPNLWQQLQGLSGESLLDNHQQAILSLEQEISALQDSYDKIRLAEARSLSESYNPVIEAKRTHLHMEIEATKELLENRLRIKQELTNIVTHPDRLPLAKLLLAQQSLPAEIKEQLQ